MHGEKLSLLGVRVGCLLGVCACVFFIPPGWPFVEWNVVTVFDIMERGEKRGTTSRSAFCFVLRTRGMVLYRGAMRC